VKGGMDQLPDVTLLDELNPARDTAPDRCCAGLYLPNAICALMLATGLLAAA
jgi:hypothetical protein